MSDKTSLLFILNPAEPASSLLELHHAAAATLRGLAPLLLTPSAAVDPQSPTRALAAPCASAGGHCHPLAVEDKKRFVAIRPKATLARLSPISSTEGESADDEEDELSASSVLVAARKPKASKKKTRLCKEKGCTSLAVSRRSCVRHGGGSRCVVEGCMNGAKLRNRCFQHGGSTVCLADGCESKAKRYGYCWSHGGGRICSSDGCDKVAAQGGLCWAHGGGNRCRLDGCTKRSYQKHGYYCKRHALYNTP